MAKILDVPTSGSIGNKTFSHNRNGQYIRQRSMPTQPRTVAQLAQRAKLSDAAAAWRGLTAVQMAAWTAFGNSFTVVGPLGTSYNLTGTQCYVKVNTVLALIGASAVSTPPLLPVFLPVTTTGVTATAGTQLIEVSGTSPASGTVYMIYASPQRSAGVSYNGVYKFMASFTAATSGQFVFTTPYTAQFGTIAIGKKIFVKVVQSQAGMQDNGTVYAVVVNT